jgi:hypothetical protein
VVSTDRPIIQLPRLCCWGLDSPSRPFSVSWTHLTPGLHPWQSHLHQCSRNGGVWHLLEGAPQTLNHLGALVQMCPTDCRDYYLDPLALS